MEGIHSASLEQNENAGKLPHRCSTVLDLQAWGFTWQTEERRLWGAGRMKRRHRGMGWR